MNEPRFIPVIPLEHMPGLTSQVVDGTEPMLWDCQVVGINVVRDFFARVRDFFGGNSRAYEKEIKASVTRMLEDMRYRACQLGADGVLGVRIRVMPFPAKGMSMVVVTISGAPVKLGKHINEVSTYQHPSSAMDHVPQS